MFLLAHCLIKILPFFDRETGFESFLRRLTKLIEYPFTTLAAILIARREKADIVHMQSVNETELLMIMALRITGFKVVFTIHNVMPRHGSLRCYHSIIYRLMYIMCNHIIIHSQSGKNDIVNLFGIMPGKISVIPHGDYKFFLPDVIVNKAEAKASVELPGTCRTILFFGAIRSNKGLDTMLFALANIKKDLPDVRLMIVGELCEDYNRYKNIIENQNIQNEVLEVLEYIPNEQVGNYFSASDIVVLPYHAVTQSGVLQIAYAFRKPVVATEVGGFNEAVENGKNGYLVPPGNVKALSEKIVDILTDEKKMERMGHYSRWLCDSKYSWDSIARRTIDMYYDV
jgi:glycosyltransferase involved in cell wall biosynthesis